MARLNRRYRIDKVTLAEETGTALNACHLGGGGDERPQTQTQTTTQVSQPWAGVQPYLTGAYERGWQLLHSGGPYQYPHSTVPQLSPERQAAQQMRAAFGTYGAPAYWGPASDAWSQLLQAPSVTSSPWAQQAIQAAINPVARTLTEQVLPGLESQAIVQGAYSGNRYPLAQAMAVERGTRAMAEAAMQSMLPLYSSGLESSARAAAMTPIMMSLPTAGADLLSQVGAEREAYQQALLNEAARKYEYEQMLPYVKLGNFVNVIQGGSGLGGTTTATSTGTVTPQQSSNPLASALGGLLLLGSLF